MTALNDDGLVSRLIVDSQTSWYGYIEHDFVTQLGNGSLPEPAFKKYLLQDYLFLIQFARAYALSAYKAQSLEDMREAQKGLSAIVDIEMDLHVGFSKNWGLSKADMEAEPEDPSCTAYTRFVLDKGMAGDLLDLQVALLPCIWGYAVIGKNLGAKVTPGNPYQAWVDMYAGDEYQEVGLSACHYVEQLGLRLGGDARFEALSATFDQGCRLEADFWQMGLRALGV